VIVSSGRGVHEALAAAEILAQTGLHAGVVDMPSVDDSIMMELAHSGKRLIFAEQNNGYLWQNFLKILYRHRDSDHGNTLSRVVSISTLDGQGKPQFIHSATYEQLTHAFGLTPRAIAEAVQNAVAAKG
jgi:transketolase